ncbi:MAG: DEAD/DEAH box helicase [Trueperaceae bacterium]|nr:DEAD/DEAH box helicase [Trueperaceae bacterium]
MFTDFALSESTLAALDAHGITVPTPVQTSTLPHGLAGRDVIAQARTGTGKTLAFALPIAERLDADNTRGRSPRALILTPTRELALQVSGEISWIAPHLKVITVYGGTGYGRQAKDLNQGCDVVVATPGRAVDYVDRKILDLSQASIVVLDEADEMLSMGFEEALEHLLEVTPRDRQTLLFSATMPSWAKKLSQQHLNNPFRADLVSDEEVTYHEIAIEVSNPLRGDVLADLLYVHHATRSIVFTHTKAEVDALVQALNANGHAAEAVHGDLDQSERERAVGRLRSGQASVLVGTNVAARGLDIPDIDLVVHYRVPNEASVYQHRSGRTGRAGRDGTVMILHDARERRDVSKLERAVSRRFERSTPPHADAVQEARLQRLLGELTEQSAEDKEVWLELAQRWVDEGNVDAIAGLLAQQLGGAQPTRSLLTGEEGWTTVHLQQRIDRIGQVVRVLKDAGASDVGRVQVARDGAYADLRPNEVTALKDRVPFEAAREVKGLEPQRAAPRRKRQGGRR